MSSKSQRQIFFEYDGEDSDDDSWKYLLSIGLYLLSIYALYQLCP